MNRLTSEEAMNRLNKRDQLTNDKAIAILDRERQCDGVLQNIYGWRIQRSMVRQYDNCYRYGNKGNKGNRNRNKMINRRGNMKYYLFLRSEEGLKEYKAEFDRVSHAINNGITPVFCELRSAKTNIIESVPYNCITATFLILGTVILSKLGVNEIISVGITLVINNICGAISNYIFTIVKHRLRIRLCERLGIDPSEHAIAVMESMEYQSV